MNARIICNGVLTKEIVDRIWTSSAHIVFPVTTQYFSISAILPAVFYMFRWGHRRGKGTFRQTFGLDPAKPTIFLVAGKLTQGNPDFATFDSEIKKDVLGDLLLCYALENKAHKEGHQIEIQRVFPTHYMSSWIDLPYSVSDLRFVPEMLVALLAEQTEERTLQPSLTPVLFSVASSLHENQLLRIFSKGVTIEGPRSNLRGDNVDESADFAIDQLLSIRLAQMCGEAPEKMRQGLGLPTIPNSWSIAQDAAACFREDLHVLLEAYGLVIPRLALVPMLESMIGLGLLNLFLTCAASVIHWQRSGTLIPRGQQRPWPLFVDASNSVDHQLRRVSEESMEIVARLFDGLPTALMGIRILDAFGRDDDALKPYLPKGPDSTEWINLLGKVRLNNHESSAFILKDVSQKCSRLATKLEEAGFSPDVLQILKSTGASSDPVDRLADAIRSLMGQKLQREHYVTFLDSCLQLDSPHGLGRKRRVPVRSATRKGSMTDVRSIVLSNALLEALVHRHICRGTMQKPLSLSAFLDTLRERYGFYVDKAPRGLSVSNEDLQRNRQTLERRLRDLGLLVGVNDAESMKRLHPRYVTNTEA